MIKFIKKFFSKSTSLISKLLGVLGIIFILLGIFLVIAYSSTEVLDNKYIVKEYKETPFSKTILKKGEVKLLKNTKYIKNGTFKITYKIKGNGNNLLEQNTTFDITDIQSSGYTIKENIIINNKKYTLDGNRITTKEKIKLSYTSSILNITIPSKKVFDTEIVINIILKNRKTNYEYRTSLDSYYSFTPNDNNDFYEKKEPQSYYLNDESYILLGTKK